MPGENSMLYPPTMLHHFLCTNVGCDAAPSLSPRPSARYCCKNLASSNVAGDSPKFCLMMMSLPPFSGWIKVPKNNARLVSTDSIASTKAVSQPGAATMSSFMYNTQSYLACATRWFTDRQTPTFLAVCVYLMPCNLTHSSEPSEPSFRCTRISCSNLECFFRLSMQSFKYGRLFQLGMRMLNIMSPEQRINCFYRRLTCELPPPAKQLPLNCKRRLSFSG